MGYPADRVSPFGVPGCVDGTEFTDFGVVLDSQFTALGLGDLSR